MQPPIQKLTNTQKPIRVGDHVSVGPLVRITESEGKSYIYILVYFDTTITDETPIHLEISEEDDNLTTITITPSKGSDVEAEEQNLWYVLVEPNRSITKGMEVEVIVDFNLTTNKNTDDEFGEPKRATRVIRPK